MKQSPMYQLYSRIAPKPEDWPVLLTKLGDLLRRDYDWSEEVAAIETPTMIVVGDADSVSAAHAVQFFELLGGGKRDAGWDGSRMSDARVNRRSVPRRMNSWGVGEKHRTTPSAKASGPSSRITYET